MKKLVIIRHGKSSWDSPFSGDHGRPLADRGLRDSPRMAQRLKKKGIFPDAILSSDAERARSTALITAENLHFPKEKIQFSPELYHASADSLLETIKKTDDAIGILFIFGHNPGFNDLIWKLGGEIDNLQTAGQYGIEFSVDSWKDINFKTAKEWFYDYPKKS